MKLKSILIYTVVITGAYACNENVEQDSLPRLEDESVIQGLVSGTGTYVDISQTLLETGASHVGIKTYPSKGEATFVDGKWLKYAAHSDFTSGGDLLELSFMDSYHSELKVVAYNFQMNLDSANFHCFMGAVGDVYYMPFDSLLTEYILANDIYCPDSVSNLSVDIISDPRHGTAYIDSNNILIYEFNPNIDSVGRDSLVYSLELVDVDGNRYLSAADVIINLLYSPDNSDSLNVDSPLLDPSEFALTEDSLFINTDSVEIGSSFYLDIYSNDFLDGANMSSLQFSQPFNGSVQSENSLDLYYTPDEGFTGLDDFSYTICAEDSSDYCLTTYVHLTVF